MPDKKHAQARRDAMQIALQLPQNADEALLVLHYAEVLVREYLAAQPAPAVPVAPARADVLRLV